MTRTEADAYGNGGNFLDLLGRINLRRLSESFCAV